MSNRSIQKIGTSRPICFDQFLKILEVFTQAFCKWLSLPFVDCKMSIPDCHRHEATFSTTWETGAWCTKAHVLGRYTKDYLPKRLEALEALEALLREIHFGKASPMICGEKAPETGGSSRNKNNHWVFFAIPYLARQIGTGQFGDIWRPEKFEEMRSVQICSYYLAVQHGSGEALTNWRATCGRQWSRCWGLGDKEIAELERGVS